MHLDEKDERKIENFFNKYDINELKSFDIILNNCATNITKCKEIFYKVLKEKENKSEVNVNSDSNLSDLINKNKKLNNDELEFFYELLDDSLFYLARLQEFASEILIKDIYIDENLFPSIYELQESLLEEAKNRREKSKTYIYTNK